jgi:T5SS/PEP-CTERM-associated repeat protein
MVDPFSVRSSCRAARLSAAAFASFAAIALLASVPARADVYWTLSPSQTGDWSVAANWGGLLPTGTDNAWIVNGGTANVTTMGDTCGTFSLGNGTGNGTVQMPGGGLSATYYEYVGSAGAGTFTQTGGTNTITNNYYSALYLGVNTGSSGTYNLSGSGQVSTWFEYVGYSGTGTFAQNGGSNSGMNNLYLGYNSGSTGSYRLSGTGLLSAPGNGITSTSGEYIGYSGTGSFTQSDASDNYLGLQCLYLGYNVGGSGSYSLSNSSQLSTRQLWVGYSGSGSFTQSGGTFSNTETNDALYLGGNPGSSGSYNLSGGEINLFVSNEFVGYSGSGTFTQSGGTNLISSYNLYIGYNAGASGTYSLSGSGLLSTAQEYVGYSPGVAALFQQTGGSNATSYVSISSGGDYLLSGGTLDITGYGGLSNLGVFDGGNGHATLSAASWSIVDLSHGTLQNVGGLTVSIAANTLLIVPPGFNPYTGFKSYSSLGITHTAGTTLVVPAGAGFGGEGSINDQVVCQGTITNNQTGYGIALNNGLVLSGTGVVETGGNLIVNDTSSGITGQATLNVQNLYVGYSGTGLFTQSGGRNWISGAYSNSVLTLGYNAGDNGTYQLSGSGLLSIFDGYAYVGYSGTGNFTQSGGTNTMNDFLYLGYNSGSNGTYTLSGSGSLATSCQFVGYNGSGTFIQSGGTNSGSGESLSIGSGSGGSGAYNLTGNGFVNFWEESIGGGGTGIFTQSGGTNSLSGSLTLTSSATYSLSGSGQLSAPTEYVGQSGIATFTQSGGTNTVGGGGLNLGTNATSAGTYNLNGGLLQLSSLVKGSGTAAFNFSGGTLQASSGFSTSLPMTLGTSGGGAAFDTAGYAVALSGLLSGPGSLTKVDSGALTLAAANTYSGNTLISGGTLALGNGLALQNSTLDTSGSGTLSFGSLTSGTLGGLTGPGTLGLSNSASAAVALSVGNNNTNTTFSGALKGGGSLTKIGTGTLDLTGSNTFRGATTVSAGVLAAGAGNALSASSALTISGGTLDASGFANTVASLNVISGGLNLGLGNTLTSTGTAALNGALNIAGTGTLGSYRLLAYTSKTGTFNSATGLDPNYGLLYNTNGTELDALHKAQVGTLTVTAANPAVITGGTTSLTVNVANSAPTSSDVLNFTAAASGAGYGLNATGSLAATSSGNLIGSFNSSSLAAGSYPGTITVTGTNNTLAGLAVNSGATQAVTVNVLGHSNPALSIAGGNNQTVIVGAMNVSASLSLTDLGTNLSPLDVSTLSGLSGSTGTAVVASGGSTSYTAALSIGSIGLAQTQSFSLKAGDEQALPGANSLNTLSQTVTWNVVDHASGGLAVAAGNNFVSHVGATGLAATISLSNAPGTRSALEVNSAPTIASGSLISVPAAPYYVSAGTSQTYTATFSTPTAGNFSDTLTFSQMGDNQALPGALALGSSSTTISGTVYRLAAANTLSSPVNLGNAHVNGTFGTQALTVQNTAGNDGFSEKLDATIAASGNATATGSINLLASGGTDNSSLVVGLGNAGTASPGPVSGTATVTFVSDGTGTSGLGTTAAGTQNVTVTGSVYRYAAANTLSSPVNVGNVHVGGTFGTQALTVQNTASTDGYSENLDVAFSGSSGSASNNGGAITLLPAGGTNGSSLTVGLGGSAHTGTAGPVSGSVTLSYSSDGWLTSWLGTSSLPSQSVTVQGNVYRLAAASGLSSTVNLGNVHVGFGFGTQALTVQNTAAGDGYSEKLDATIAASGNASAGGSISLLGAGSSSSNLLVGLGGSGHTGTAGAVSGTATVTLTSDGTGTSGLGTTSLGTQSVTVTGGVYRLAAPNSLGSAVNLGYVHVGGTFGTQALTVQNTASNDGYSEKLDATIAASGNASAGGSINLLAAGATDSSSLTVGLGGSAHTGAAGAVSGTATVTLTSDGTGSSGLKTTSLGTQNVTVTGSVYSGKSVWAAGGGGTWGTLASNFGANWAANNGSPGLDPNFQQSDTATFGTSVASGAATVTLDGASPSLAALTFSNTNASFTITQGSGGTLGLNAGSGTAPIAVQGNHAIAAPLALAGNAAVTTVTAADSLALSGAISGPGGLQQNGPGTVVLQGTGNYFGPTTVNGGKLEVDGWLTNSAVTVDGGGTLDGTGYLSSVTVEAGGQLMPGDAPGVMHLSDSLILESGAKMDYDLDGLPTDDEISMPLGSVTLNDQQFADFTFTYLAGFKPGTYTLIAAHSIGGTLGADVSGAIDGYSAMLALQGNDLVLNVAPEPSTLALLAAGAAGLLGYGWRRRRALRRTAKPSAIDQPQDAPPILSFPSRSAHANAARRAA